MTPLLLLLVMTQPLAASERGGDGESTVRRIPARLATSANHTCFAAYDGTVRCWGLNDAGQVGDGTTVNPLSPQIVKTAVGQNLVDMFAVATGRNHSCGIGLVGTLYCW